MPATATTVKVKKKCCKDGPRCKKCPVVWKKLSNEGLAVRLDKRLYVVEGKVPKSAMKLARKR